jgi:hypothetical protein
MPTYEPYRQAVNIPHTPASLPFGGEVVRPPYSSASSASSTDGMMLLSHARERMLAERLNAEMARDRLALVREMRREQRQVIREEAPAAWADMIANRDNPLYVGSMERSYLGEQEDIEWTIRYAQRRGW